MIWHATYLPTPGAGFEGIHSGAWERRQLSTRDLARYQKIVVALSETIRLMREIDEVIPGWPLPERGAG